MKSKGIDSFVRDFVTKYLNLIIICFLLLCSLVVRYHLMKHGSSFDYVEYFDPWVKEYRKSIRLALKNGVGDYYIPYNIFLAIASLLPIPTNYSIGAISCIFDYLTCFFIYRILSENFSQVIDKTIAAIISVAYLFIPTIVLNGATWKQCDAIYAFFLIVFLKCIIDDRIRTAFVMLGIAYSFKQQAIFVIPLLIILYFIKKNIKLVYFVYTLIVFLIAGLPAIFMGRPAIEVYSIYFSQVSEYNQMTLNYPNLYLITMMNYETLHIYALAFTVIILALTFFYIVGYMKSLSSKNVFFLAAWIVWTCCMFLPKMHQRYDYMVAILFTICIPLLKKERFVIGVVSMILFEIGNIITYSYSLFGNDYNFIFVLCCNAIAYGLFSYLLCRCLAEEKNSQLEMRN